MSEDNDPEHKLPAEHGQSDEKLVDHIVEQIVTAEGVEDFFECLTQTLYDPHQRVCTASSATPADLLAAIESLQKHCAARHHPHISNYLGMLAALVADDQTVPVRWALAKLTGRALAEDAA